MKKVYFEKSVDLYELKKTYTDDVEFISDTATFPMVKGIAYEGRLNKAIRNKLHSKDMKKKVDRLLEVYKRRLFRHWDDHIDRLLHALDLPTIHKGGPGSGCQGPNCGRPATSVAEFHEQESEIPEGTLNVQDVRPALRYKGQIFIGTKGDSHASIYDKNKTIMSTPTEGGGRAGDWGHIEQGFIDSPEAKNWVSRETLSHEFGTHLSEDLAFYQEHGRIPHRDKYGWLKMHKADEENKDSSERKTAIATIVAGLGASLAGTALDYYRQAYLLGKERGISISGQDFRAAVSEEASKRIQNFSDGNKEYLNGFMENLNDKFNNTIDQEYATKEAEAEAIKRVAAGAEARLALYVTAILGAFAFGMTDGIKEGEEEKEPGEAEVTGIIWITQHDESVCPGCTENDGKFFTLDEFDSEYQQNECLTRCRCAESSEPTTAPAEHFARSARIKDLAKGGPGSGCNPAVATCGRPKSAIPKEAYLKSGKGVTKSWLLPEKYNTVPVSENDLHGEFAEKHFGSMKEAFKQGLVRKTGPRGFQFEHGNNDAIERVERDIEENVKDYHSSTDSRDDYILLDTFETENYNHTGYQISYQELKDNDYKIKDLLNNKNMIKFEKGGPGSGCVGANCGRKPNPESLQLKELRPALNDSGRIFVGKYGQTHGDVYNDHENDFNDEATALPGFVDPKGNFYSRSELHGVTAELVQEQLKRFDEFITLKKGGPGSGCNPEVGTCGRPKGSGTAEESTAIPEPTMEETSTPQATQQPIQQPEAVRTHAQTEHKRILQSKFDSFFSPSDMKVGSEKDVQIIREHLPEVMVAYDKETMNEYHTSIPVVSSGDLPKTMDLPFREGFQPKDSASRHAAASVVSKIFDEKHLNDPANRDKDVMILAGTSGAGKTHTTRTLGAHLENFALVKDTNLNNFESAKRNIDKALSTSHKVQILYVERDPIEAFTDGVFPRSLKAKSKGRLVPIEVHLKNSMARDTIKQVADIYKDNPNVVIRAFANRTGEDVHAIRLDEIKSLPYTMNEARTKLTNFIKEKYDTGQITQSVYNAFLTKE